jgi:hypothetical protein
MSHPTNNDGLVVPKSLVQQIAEAKTKQIQEQQAELPEQRTQVNPNETLDPSRRVISAKPPGAAIGRIAPRPGGVLATGAVPVAGRDRQGNIVRQPNVGTLRGAQQDEQQ